jgi:hypothetical protein
MMEVARFVFGDLCNDKQACMQLCLKAIAMVFAEGLGH